MIEKIEKNIGCYFRNPLLTSMELEICAGNKGHTATAQILVGANANLEAATKVLLSSVVDPCVPLTKPSRFRYS